MNKTALLFAALTAFIPASALAGSFTVTDDRASIEVSEVSRLYIDGALVAVFRLDENTPSITKTIETPAGRINHNYALCGHITILTPEGKTQTHEVSSEGILNAPDGHHLVGLGDENFTDFFLRDPSDPDVAVHRKGRAAICAAPIS